MIALLLALTLSAPVCQAPRDANGFVRSRAVRATFMRTNPCPGGPDAGSVRRCRGWQVHHLVPLQCSGVDDVSNMAWVATEKHQEIHRRTVCRAVCVMRRAD